MANLIYNSFKRDGWNGSVDLDTDSVKAMLLTNAYTPDQDAHTKRSDLTNEVVGTGYTAGGVALTTKAVTVDNTDNEGVFDADDAVWATATITARYLALYKARGGAASADELIALWDFGLDISSTNAEFRMAWNAEGILNNG